ncbi:hypothetical protein HN011_007464 [Eciton burchellii]|nr:hypothetical protein HN011_007464 [Eciton burchellii]
MCDHYYNCYNGKIYPKALKCASELLFNPILRVCDYPENVDCDITPGTITQSTFITSLSSISRATSTPITSTSSSLTEEISTTKITNMPTITTTGTSSATSDTTSDIITTTITTLTTSNIKPTGTSKSTSIDTTSKATNPTTDIITYTTTETPNITTKKPNKPREKCPPKGSPKKGRIPHPYQCHLYYECENGEKVLAKCPTGQHFDYNREVCDWAVKVKCIRPIPPIHNMENDETNEDYQLELSLYNLDITTCIGVCPEENIDSTILLPNNNCKKFCICKNDMMWIQPCPGKLYFDSVDNVCKQKKDATCTVPTNIQHSISEIAKIKEINIIKSVNIMNNNENKMSNKSVLNTSSNNLDPSTCIGTCPEEDPDYAVLLPNEDCKKFCMCSNGIAWVQSCPEPLHFDSVDKQLEIEEGNQKIQDNDWLETSFYNLDPSACIGTCPEKDPDYAVLLPNDDCKKFCLCSNGIAWVQPCPEPLYFDSVDKD